MLNPVYQQVAQLDVEVASLVPLTTGQVFGIEKHSSLITLTTKPTGMQLLILSFINEILRIQNKKFSYVKYQLSNPPVYFIV